MAVNTPITGAKTVVACTPITTAPVSNEIFSTGDRVAAAQANVVGTGAVSATVALQASLDGVYFTTIYTFTLSGTTSASDIQLLDATFQVYRWSVSSISGTSAAVTGYLKT